jgi:hypothetical protein
MQLEIVETDGQVSVPFIGHFKQSPLVWSR